MAFTATNAVITDDRITFTLLENIRANTIVSKFANTNSNTGASATVLIVDTKGTDYELFSITDKNQLVYLGAEQDEGAAPREFSLSLLVSTKDSSTASAQRQLFTTSFEVSDADTSLTASDYTEFKIGDGSDKDVLDASSKTGAQLIQGGTLDDTITASAHGDIVIGGYGDDAITLGAGVDTVVYRIASQAASVRADDGGDIITGFNRGTDKLVFVDTDETPLTDFSALIALAKLPSPQVVVKLLGTAASYTGVQFEFTAQSKDDGPNGIEAISGSNLTVNFSTPLGNLAAIFTLFGNASIDVRTNVLTPVGLDALDDIFGVDNIDVLSSADSGFTFEDTPPTATLLPIDAPDAPQTPEAETNGVITLASSSKTLNEGYNAAQYLTQISFADNADGAKTAYLNEADGQYFEIRNGNELRLKAGRLDFEVASKHTITIRTNDPDTGNQSASKTFTLNLNDVNISLANLANKEFDGAILAGERVGDADALVTGAAQNLQDARYALSGEDASKFNIDIATGVITARAFIAPRISTDYDLTVKVYARYGDHSEYATDSFTVSVNKGQAPAPTKATVMTLSAQTRTLDEDTTARTKLADISFNNDASGANTATIPNSDIFEIDSNVLYLKADAPLDFETTPSHAITLTSGTNNALTKTFTLTVADVDEAPTAIVLSATTLAIGEDVATRTVVQAVENPPAPTTVTLTTRGGDENSPAPSVSGASDDAPAPAPAPPAPVVTHETVFVRTKLIDISFTDDALGTNTATIPDSDIFEIDANVLYLKANAPLNFQTTDSYSIVISASTNSALTQTFTLTVNNLLMTGTARDDVLAGGAGDDTINGGRGDDVLVGQAGDNVLNGGAGDDQLFGTVISLADRYGTFIGGGDNTLNGGAG